MKLSISVKPLLNPTWKLPFETYHSRVSPKRCTKEYCKKHEGNVDGVLTRSISTEIGCCFQCREARQVSQTEIEDKLHNILEMKVKIVGRNKLR